MACCTGRFSSPIERVWPILLCYIRSMILEWRKRLGGKMILSLVLPLTIQVSCNSGPAPADQPSPTEQTEGTVSEDIAAKIRGAETGDFTILAIKNEGTATRIDVQLVEPVENEAEAKRRTINALYAIQSAVGTDQWIAVWSYAGNPRNLQGMAFYSSVSEKLVFKAPGEL